MSKRNRRFHVHADLKDRLFFGIVLEGFLNIDPRNVDRPLENGARAVRDGEQVLPVLPVGQLAGDRQNADRRRDPEQFFSERVEFFLRPPRQEQIPAVCGALSRERLADAPRRAGNKRVCHGFIIANYPENVDGFFKAT